MSVLDVTRHWGFAAAIIIIQYCHLRWAFLCHEDPKGPFMNDGHSVVYVVVSVLTGNFSELFRAFISLFGAILMGFDHFDGISHAKPCLKSRNFASLQQLKFKSRSFKFFWMGSGPETVHFLPCNLNSLLLTSCMVNPPQARKVRNSAIKTCSC